MNWMQRLKRVFHIDIEHCGVCGGTLRVIACIETPLKCRSRSELARSSRGSSLISPPARPAPSTTPAHRRPAATLRLIYALRPTPCLTRSHHCRLHQISSPRPRNVCARTDNVPDNDHASSTTPLLLQQRRSAGYFAYPSTGSSGRSGSEAGATASRAGSAPLRVLPAALSGRMAGTPPWFATGHTLQTGHSAQ